MIIEGRDCLRDSRRCMVPDWDGVGGVNVPSENGDSGTSMCVRCVLVGGGIFGLVSAGTLTNVPNRLNRSVVGDIGGLDCCEPSQS